MDAHPGVRCAAGSIPDKCLEVAVTIALARLVLWGGATSEARTTVRLDRGIDELADAAGVDLLDQSLDPPSAAGGILHVAQAAAGELESVGFLEDKNAT